MILDDLNLLSIFTLSNNKMRSQAKYLVNNATYKLNYRFKHRRQLIACLQRKKCHTKSVTFNVTLACENIYSNKSKEMLYISRILANNSKPHLHKLFSK